jgi:hypothetical protein
MVSATILTFPDPQVWHLLELPAPDEIEETPVWLGAARRNGKRRKISCCPEASARRFGPT